MLTKIATGQTVEFFLFDRQQEEEYFNEACQFCLDMNCNDDCVMPFPVNAEECDSCDRGRVRFLMRPADNGEPYYVITKCGFCDGLGLI